MKMNDELEKSLRKSLSDAESASESLRKALNAGNAVESLLILPMIERSVLVEQSIRALITARFFV
jgi:hypothetical protein